jgi:hypothetical protein
MDVVELVGRVLFALVGDGHVVEVRVGGERLSNPVRSWAR